MNQLVECVPNFSEGRDEKIISEIRRAIESVSGIEVLDVDMGADTNRTVVTFVGTPDIISEAAFNFMVQEPSGIIDLLRAISLFSNFFKYRIISVSE